MYGLCAQSLERNSAAANHTDYEAGSCINIYTPETLACSPFLRLSYHATVVLVHHERILIYIERILAEIFELHGLFRTLPSIWSQKSLMQ